MGKTTVIQVLKAIDRIVTLRLPAALNQIPPYAPFLPEKSNSTVHTRSILLILLWHTLPVCIWWHFSTHPRPCNSCYFWATFNNLSTEILFLWNPSLLILCITLHLCSKLNFATSLPLRWKETTCLFSNHSKINMPSSDPKATPFCQLWFNTVCEMTYLKNNQINK